MARAIWRGREWQKKAVRHLEGQLTKAAIFIQGDIVRSFPNTAFFEVNDDGSQGKRILGSEARELRRSHRSKPGEIPHRDTGHLSRNVNWDKSRKLTRRVGSGIGSATSVGYAAFLEFGTSRMAARPWLRPGFRRGRNRVTRILGKPVPE